MDRAPEYSYPENAEVKASREFLAEVRRRTRELSQQGLRGKRRIASGKRMRTSPNDTDSKTSL